MSFHRPYNEGGKITFFVVNSVALVDQHTKYVKQHTDFRVASYTGEMNLDFWNYNRWQKNFSENQVLVMTSQILNNIIDKKMIGEYAESALFENK